MLRIRAVTPIHVDDDELRRRQSRYDRLAPPGVSIRLDDLGADSAVPRELQTAEDVRRSEALVVEEIRRTDPVRFDAVLPDCVLDPGVGLGIEVALPVLGLLRLSTHLLAGAGRRFAAVTRTAAIGEELRRKVATYGLAGSLSDVRILGLAVEHIRDDRAWAAAITRSVTDLSAPAVLNGCSAVDVHPAATGPRIVDPTAMALQALGLTHHLGLLGRRAGRAAR